VGLTSNDLEAVVRAIREVCEQEVEPDGLVFDDKSVQGERINEDADYEGVRIRMIAYLSKARVSLQVDIGK
jgi:hypothetical protein